MAASDIAPGSAPGARPAKARNRFFLIASALMTLIVFLGFLPSFYFRAQFRDTPLPVHLIVHGVIMTVWQLLFLAQTILVAAGRTDLHRRLGMAGAGLAIAVIASGIQASLAQRTAYAGMADAFPFPISDLIVSNLFGFAIFGGLVAAAIRFRRDRAAHPRLIFWACVVTMGPAVTPMRTLGSIIAPYFPATIPPEVSLVWIAWAALLCHDWFSARKFHPATIVGGMLILFIGPALLDWVLLIDAVTAWASPPA